MNYSGHNPQMDFDGAGSDKNKRKTKIFLIAVALILISMFVASLILGDYTIGISSSFNSAISKPLK